jgi:phasin family protein
MSTLPEQFSAARTRQLEAQFNFIRAFTGQAFASAEKLIALNFSAARASLEQSSIAARQLMAARDPRDLLCLGACGEQQFETILAYSRRLAGIAGAQPALDAAAPAAALVAAETAAPAISAQPVEPPVVAEPAPVAKEKPIAKAVAKADAKLLALPMPADASFPAVPADMPGPVEAAAPPPVSGSPVLAPKKARAASSKVAKKK